MDKMNNLTLWFIVAVIWGTGLLISFLYLISLWLERSYLREAQEK